MIIFLGESWGHVFTVSFICITVLSKEHMLQCILRLCILHWFLYGLEVKNLI